MKNRNRQRHNRRVKEEMLDLRDMCGVKDSTPYEAVKEIICRTTFYLMSHESN